MPDLQAVIFVALYKAVPLSSSTPITVLDKTWSTLVGGTQSETALPAGPDTSNLEGASSGNRGPACRSTPPAADFSAV